MRLLLLSSSVAKNPAGRLVLGFSNWFHKHHCSSDKRTSIQFELKPNRKLCARLKNKSSVNKCNSGAVWKNKWNTEVVKDKDGDGIIRLKNDLFLTLFFPPTVAASARSGTIPRCCCIGILREPGTQSFRGGVEEFPSLDHQFNSISFQHHQAPLVLKPGCLR